MPSLEYYRSQGKKDFRAGYAKCDYPDKLTYEEISWWTEGWNQENEKQKKMKPHPLNCETCDFATKLTLDASKCPVGESYPNVYACSKQKGKWMPSLHDGNVMAIVGCASHSNNKKCKDVLETLYTEFNTERLDSKNSDMPYAYFDGKCDAIDIAIQKIENI